MENDNEGANIGTIKIKGYTILYITPEGWHKFSVVPSIITDFVLTVPIQEIHFVTIQLYYITFSDFGSMLVFPVTLPYNYVWVFRYEFGNSYCT